MTNDQIASALLAAHNIALALGGIARMLGLVAFVLVIYPWIGGFGSMSSLKIELTDRKVR